MGPFPVYEMSVGPSGPKFAEVEAVDELDKDFTAGQPGCVVMTRSAQVRALSTKIRAREPALSCPCFSAVFAIFAAFVVNELKEASGRVPYE